MKKFLVLLKVQASYNAQGIFLEKAADTVTERKMRKTVLT